MINKLQRAEVAIPEVTTVAEASRKIGADRADLLPPAVGVQRSQDRTRPGMLRYTAAPAVKGDGWLPPEQLMMDCSLGRLPCLDTRRSEAPSRSELRSVSATKAAIAK